jgi:hypothetical protein
MIRRFSRRARRQTPLPLRICRSVERCARAGARARSANAGRTDACTRGIGDPLWRPGSSRAERLVDNCLVALCRGIGREETWAGARGEGLRTRSTYRLEKETAG